MRILFLLALPLLVIFASSTPRFGSVIRLESRFDTEIRFGTAIMVSLDGMVATKANVVFDLQRFLFPNVIFGQIQEDSAYPPICYAEYSILALDEDRELALLEVKNFTDIYCNPIQKSSFHKEYAKKNHLNLASQDICPLNPNKNDKIYTLLYETHEKTGLVKKEGRVTEFIYQRDTNGSNYATHFQSDIKMPKDTDGAPVFAENELFLGLMERKEIAPNQDGGISTITSKALIIEWMCDLSKKGLLNTKLKKESIDVPLHKHPVCNEFINKEKR